MSRAKPCTPLGDTNRVMEQEEQGTACPRHVLPSFIPLGKPSPVRTSCSDQIFNACPPFSCSLTDFSKAHLWDLILPGSSARAVSVVRKCPAGRWQRMLWTFPNSSLTPCTSLVLTVSQIKANAGIILHPCLSARVFVEWLWGAGMLGQGVQIPGGGFSVCYLLW